MSIDDSFSASHDHTYQEIVSSTGSGKNIISRLLGVLFSLTDQPREVNNTSKMIEESTQTLNSHQDRVLVEAEFLAQDIIFTFDEDNPKKPPNKYCATLRRTVKEMCERHDLVFKGIANRMEIDEENALQIFLIIADEIFVEGQVNWGRIVAIYAFAAHLARHVTKSFHDSKSNDKYSQEMARQKSVAQKEKISHFVGKYVGNKLGTWIQNHGGWDGFVETFPDKAEFESKILKGVLFTALGLGALATLVGSR